MDLEQYQALRPVVAGMFAAVAEIKNAPKKSRAQVSKRVAKRIASENHRLENGSSVLNLGVGSWIVSWCRRLASQHPEEDLDDFTENQVLRGLSWVATLHDLAHQLYEILTKEQGVDYVSFRCYVESGLALEAFAAVDPNLHVVRTGIDSFYDKVCVQEQKSSDLCVPTILDYVARALTPQ